MNPQNTKSDTVVRNETVCIQSEREDIRVIKSRMIASPDLSISEDSDPGSDPYNNTGQHVIIKSRIDLQD